MPTHPSAGNRDNSLANGLAWYFKQQHIPFVFRCNNRLDRDTSGITIITKHMLSASLLSAMILRHEVCREYLAIVRGYDLPDSGTIDAPLSRKPGSIIERIVDKDHGERAVTHYRVVKKKTAQPCFPETGNRPYPSNPYSFKTSGFSFNRRLSV